MYKMTTFTVDPDNYSVVSDELVKTASFELPDGMEYDPDFLYLKIRAVSAGEYYGPNKNLDYFPEEELKKQHPTFLQAHTFKNHENKKVENAIGDVLASHWNDKMKGVELYIRIDRKIAPNIVRGFEKGIMTDVSMGCRVEKSVCSICGNSAKRRSEFCEHILHERGMIYDDGRQVYEINIRPRFHDISAVKVGAEHVAKAIGIYVDEGKVAFNHPSDMEKVASADIVNSDMIMHFSDKKVKEVTASEFIEDMEKIASFSGEDPYQLEKLAEFREDSWEPRRGKPGKISMQKLAELKKMIQGHVVGIAEDEFIDENSDKIEKAANFIRLKHPHYWPADRCKDIADELKVISLDKRSHPMAVFSGFLKGLDYAGINITPLELHNIRTAMLGGDPIDLAREVGGDALRKRDNPSYVGGVDKVVDTLNIPADVGKVIAISSDPKGSSLPPKKIIRIIKRTSSGPGVHVGDDVMQHIIRRVIRPNISERSLLGDGVIKISRGIMSGELKPRNNAAHFIPIEVLMNSMDSGNAHLRDMILSAIMYAAYQRERERDLFSGETSRGIIKFAHELSDMSMMEKVAFRKKRIIPKWGYGKAIAFGTPATYAYSGIQRARMEQGKDVGTVNTFVARNPGTAAALGVASTPLIREGANTLNDFAIKATDAIKRNASKVKAGLGKKASEVDTDMFIDKDINNDLSGEYTPDDLEIIKLVCIMRSDGRTDEANELLIQNGLTDEDVKNYLDSSKENIKEKIASQVYNGDFSDSADHLPEKTLLQVYTTHIR